ncbi:hypothetical protein [Nocardia salmonicida]|uniref:hypothetical protein n=1 Tax=Nocardia salmonicida TaxID=53431 RepID=UPI00379BF45C
MAVQESISDSSISHATREYLVFRNPAEENLLSHIVLPCLRSSKIAQALPGIVPKVVVAETPRRENVDNFHVQRSDQMGAT